jgi:hypothetical protein
MSLDAPTDEETFRHFREHGWMRVRAAFSADEAEAMRAVVGARSPMSESDKPIQRHGPGLCKAETLGLSLPRLSLT